VAVTCHHGSFGRLRDFDSLARGSTVDEDIDTDRVKADTTRTRFA